MLMLNYLKPWGDWSLLSLSNDSDFKQYVKNYKINYNGSDITYSSGTYSYFTNNEVTIITSFLENTYQYKSHYYTTLSELQVLEEFLLSQIKELINSTSTDLILVSKLFIFLKKFFILPSYPFPRHIFVTKVSVSTIVAITIIVE